MFVLSFVFRSILQHGLPDIMVTITESGTLCLHGWLPYDKSISNYFTFEKDPTLDNVKTRRKLGPFSPGIQLTAKMFIVTHDGKLLVSGGHWDNSIRVYSIAKTKTTQHILRHTGMYFLSRKSEYNFDYRCNMMKELHQKRMPSTLFIDMMFFGGVDLSFITYMYLTELYTTSFYLIH